MPWDDIARRDHDRREARYASDLTDREWSLIAGFLPPPRPLGRPRTTVLREVANAILQHGLDRLPMADAAQRPAACVHGAALLPRLA